MSDANPDPNTKVLYNDQCPVCSYEITHYKGYSERCELPIRFDDLNTEAAHWGMDADVAARRLYVEKDGQLLSGMPAFRALWTEMPRYRLLARVAGWPVVRPLSEFAYDRVLAPLIYRWHKRRQARGVSA
jgi:predicted DCC family thiol-disulfide oxidoreductase YuxK